MRRRFLLVAASSLTGALMSLSGCGHLGAFAPRPAAAVANPFHVGGASLDQTWERTIDTLHKYGFRIARESKLEYRIETEPMVGSGVLEPWFGDSVGRANRLESTLQSIRRRVVVTIMPHEAGGFLVGVEAMKEKEDVAGQVANSPGLAATQEYRDNRQNLDRMVGQTQPSGWYLLGRDFALEQHLAESLQAALTDR